MDAATFHARRRYADTGSGRIAYFEEGRGPAALFVHGVPLNGFHWRHVVAGLGPLRRLVEVPDARLFFAEDRPRALVEPLVAFLQG
jgi:pimeloyl-ACP methyl ester carboxylesterase